MLVIEARKCFVQKLFQQRNLILKARANISCLINDLFLFSEECPLQLLHSLVIVLLRIGKYCLFSLLSGGKQVFSYPFFFFFILRYSSFVLMSLSSTLFISCTPQFIEIFELERTRWIIWFIGLQKPVIMALEAQTGNSQNLQALKSVIQDVC